MVSNGSLFLITLTLPTVPPPGNQEIYGVKKIICPVRKKVVYSAIDPFKDKLERVRQREHDRCDICNERQCVLEG
jgi:hypothetical protein